MPEATAPDPKTSRVRLTRDGARSILRDVFHIILHLAILLIAAGTRRWIAAWVIGGLGLLYQAVNTLVLLRWNPELLNRRGQLFSAGTKTFDKVFVALYLPLGIAVSVICGLDAVRYGWSRMPLAFMLLGVMIFILSCALGLWAMAVNAHFEATVWVGERQRVCTAGPYRIVRHPGYAAAMIGAPGYPLILGSWWGLGATAALVGLFVVRTALEDRTLRRELPGYREYAEQTRYRLIPGVW